MKKYLQKHDKIKYSDNWSTPVEIYDYYINKLKYYDPCPLNSNIDLMKYVNKDLYINPPYSNISNWIDFAIENKKRYNKEVVLLIPSRTDTKYFHKLLEFGIEIEFIKGRLKFGNYKKAAPFPSIIVRLLGG